MNREQVEDIERTIFSSAAQAPGELRDAVLRDVRRELTAARWDRWLGRAAAALLIVGVGLNGILGWQGARDADALLVGSGRGREALVETAIAVAAATDAETGRRFARQMAALGGWSLTDEQWAAIDAAAQGPSRNRTEG